MTSMGQHGCRPATADDLTAVTALLRTAGLPTSGVPSSLAHFVVAVRGSQVVGAGGLELYGENALLRSVVVASTAQEAGIGTGIVDRLIVDAMIAHVTDIYLLTTTAQAYFARRGFRVIDRAAIPADLFMSAELQGACPASAITMHLTI